MHQILFFSDKEFHERAEHMLEKLGLANEVSLKIVASKQYAAPTPEDLNGCEAFISESALITAEVAENLRQAGIRCCSVMSIGMNHVDVDACTQNGIIVTNCLVTVLKKWLFIPWHSCWILCAISQWAINLCWRATGIRV